MRKCERLFLFVTLVLGFCSQALANDPSQLAWGSYVGGTAHEEATAIAVDETGAAYLGGQSASPEYVTTGSYDTVLDGPNDGCVAKLSPSGESLIFATFLGGSDTDTIYNVLLDGDGNIYVSGHTNSDDFPVTPGAYDETYNGGGDVFVAKFNPSGDTLLFSTFIGGSGDDQNYENSMAMDASGAVYLCGATSSGDFPVTEGAHDETYNGNGDSFVLKLTPDGDGVTYSTFIGGHKADSARAIAAAPSGEVYMMGVTFSNDFPATNGAYDESYNGGADWFVAKLDNTGSALDFATYLGGSGNEAKAKKLFLTPTGDIYVSGSTESSNFPTTPGAYDRVFSYFDGYDLVTAKFGETGNLLASTFGFGGNGLALDSGGNVWCIAELLLSNAIATPGAYRNKVFGSTSVLASIDPGLAVLRYSTYVPGPSYPVEIFLAIDASDSLYGFYGAYDSGWPVTPGAFDPSYNGERDQILVKFDPKVIALPTLVCPLDITPGCSTERMLQVMFPDPEVSVDLAGTKIQCFPPSGSEFPIGVTRVYCVATFRGGYTTTCSFAVIRSPLQFRGFRQPIGGSDETGGSRFDPVQTFELGATIPVRFTAACDFWSVETGIHTLRMTKHFNSSNNVKGVANEVKREFAFTDRGWEVILNSAELGPGTWKLVATLSDRSKHTAWIKITK